MTMKLDHLSDSDFEELTYDLLRSLGFVNVNWRRGSGKGGASPDQGRDIVAQLRQQDIDDAERLETWFVQCKHYERGVPPDTLEPAVAWALAERPSVLLVVVSNFLSNPAKNWLEDYERNNRPVFRFKTWERKDLERLLSSFPVLSRKYKLVLGNPEPSIHPAHLRYMLNPSVNTLDHLFAFLDTMDSRMRDRVFDFGYLHVLNPRFRKPKNDNETMMDLMLGPYGYPAFRSKCFELRQSVAEAFLVQAILSEALQWAWRFADPAQCQETIENQRRAIEYFTEELDKTEDEKRRAVLEKVRTVHNDWIKSAPDRQKVCAGYYKYICETLLPHLYLEDPRFIQRATNLLSEIDVHGIGGMGRAVES